MRTQHFLTVGFRSRILFFLLFLLVATAQAQSISEEKKLLIQKVEQSLSPSKADGVDTRWSLAERMEFHNITGVSIAVINDYTLDWAKAYGWADKENKIEATTNTLFQAASISKSIHAIGFLHWVETNAIDLDADFSNYVSSWKLKSRKKANGKKIAIANLLSHTGGLSGHGFNGYQQGKKIPSLIQILNGKKPANSDQIKSIEEPNREFKYSGGGVLISQLILGEHTGIPYDEYMEKTVLNKLEMHNSTFTQPSPNEASLATAYWHSGNPLDGKYHIYPEQAAASLWTTPTDLSQFIIEMQKSLLGESNLILSKEMTERMTKPYLKDGLTGLGVFRETINDKPYFTHGGSNEGFKCYYYGSMEGGNGLVIMTNSENFVIIPEIIRSVANVYEW